jgi:hypothetical protein
MRGLLLALLYTYIKYSLKEWWPLMREIIHKGPTIIRIQELQLAVEEMAMDGLYQ